MKFNLIVDLEIFSLQIFIFYSCLCYMLYFRWFFFVKLSLGCVLIASCVHIWLKFEFKQEKKRIEINSNVAWRKILHTTVHDTLNVYLNVFLFSLFLLLFLLPRHHYWCSSFILRKTIRNIHLKNIIKMKGDEFISLFFSLISFCRHFKV